MEDVLEVYHRPYDASRPMVCFDEGSKQQVKETRMPLPPYPGAAAKYDYEYERNGTGNLFVCFAPLDNWRHVKVTEQRTMIDFAQVMKDLVDVHFPHAEKIILVMDNLNTHKYASLYHATTWQVRSGTATIIRQRIALWEKHRCGFRWWVYLGW